MQYKVRVRQKPSGSQENFAMVRNNKIYDTSRDADTEVRDTIQAVPREDANLEAEKGETVLVNAHQPAFLKIGGKKHYDGGTPLNVPEGSFIFSDYLKIKDNDLLTSVFGMPKNKKGYSPAEISKKFPINDYIVTLRDETTDPIAKRTAFQMYQKNMEKLGMLALAQESMKGFEDGVPSIAESALAGLSGEAQQYAKMGGLKKYQVRGPVKNLYPTPIVIGDSIPADTIVTPTKQPVVTDKKPYVKYEGNNKFLSVNKEDFKNQDVLSKVITISNEIGALPIYYTADLINQALDYPVSLPEGGIEYINELLGSPLSLSGEGLNKRVSAKDLQNRDMLQVKPTNRNFVNSVVPKDKPSARQSSSATTQKYSPVQVDDLYLPSQVPNVDSLFNKKLGGLVKYQKGAEVKDKPLMPEFFSESFYKDAKDFEGKKIQQDTEGRIHYYDPQSKKYLGFIYSNKPSEFFSWDNTNKYYIGRDIKQNNKFTKYHIPIVTKDMQDRVKSSRSYQKGVIEFNKMVDTDEQFRKGYLAYYNKNYPNSKKTDAQKFEDLKQQQTIGVTHDLMFGTYYPEYVAFIQNDDKFDAWDAPKDFSTGKPRKDLINENYNQSASMFGLTTPKTVGGADEFGKDIQKAYLSSQDYFNSDPNAIENIVNNWGFAPAPTGRDDEMSGYSRTSKEDGYIGDTTAWQHLKYNVTPNEDFIGPPTYDYGTPTEDTTTNEEDETYSPPQRTKFFDTWFAPDITNFVGAITDKINRYEPAQGKVAFRKPGYDLLDPTRQLAANQEQMARYQNQIENASDSNVGLAAMLAASGAGFQNAATVLGNIENQNVAIVNNAYAQNAQIENAEQAANEQMRQQYISQMATLNQNEDEARNLKKWRAISAWNQGHDNYTRDKLMEEVLFPQMHFENITGDYTFAGGKDPLANEDVYQNIYTYMLGQQGARGGRRANKFMAPDEYISTKQSITKMFADKGLTGEELKSETDKYMQQYLKYGYSDDMQMGGLFSFLKD